MKQKVIEHAARKISFCTDELKPWTFEEENLIAVYISLHDREMSLKSEGNELLTLTGNLDKETEKGRIKLMALKEKITAVSKLADHFVIVDPNRQSLVDEVNREAEKVSKDIEAYSDVLSEVESAATACEEKNSPFIRETEDISCWEKFEDIKHEYFEDYEAKAIDIVSFCDDEEMFKELAHAFSNHNNGIIDFANNAIDNYNKLMLQTEMQYAIWEEFLKRLSVIRMITESEADKIFTSDN